MRIVLINPCTDHQLQTHRHGVGHLGLGYIAACLLRQGHDVRGIDAKEEKLSQPGVIDRIRDIGPDMVGVTAMTHEIWHAGQLCADIKAAMPDCVTVAGGPHATALPERTLREFPAIDVVVHGEGEQTASELADAIDGETARCHWGNILGIAYRDGGDVHLTSPRPPIEELDALPFPAWEAFPEGLRWPLYAGRGCPFRCAFCQRVLGGRIRMRSVDNVLAEMDAMQERLGYRSSWFQDETFGVDARWTDEFLDKLIDRNERRGYVWRWKANSRANLADPEKYRKMRRAGCRVLDFGIESGCHEILKRIHKNITLAQAREAVRCARDADIHTNAFFIIGHPGETWATALQTVLFAPRLRADDIAVGVMVPYPGTEIWEMARRGEWGYKLLTEDWRAYDKYFGNALEVHNLSHRRLELLQVLTYLAFYLGTGRFVQLGRFVFRFRREALRMLTRLIPTPKRRRPHRVQPPSQPDKEPTSHLPAKPYQTPACSFESQSPQRSTGVASAAEASLTTNPAGSLQPTSTAAWPVVIVTCAVVWLLVRAVFFVGIAGSDDMYHMRFAALWDRAPVNHWEARLLPNALIACAMKLFGRTELAAVLPCAAASLAILGSVLYWCRHYATVRHGWWAGLLVAVLPIDVEGATSISAFPIMVGLMSVGTVAFLRAPNSNHARRLAALALSLGVVAHLAGFYYVASLAVTALWIDRRRFTRPVVTTFLVGLGVMIADMAVFYFAYGDALGRFRACLGQAPTENPLVPMYVGERFNWTFVAWPFTTVVYSKAFGLSLVVPLAVGLWKHRRLETPARILLAVSVVYWLWMSFGSQTPWAYQPFWRLARFWQPLTLAAALLFATAIVMARRRLPCAVGASAVLAVSVLNMLGSGSWGQNVNISRELLTYVETHPDKRFVTDYHTLNEMYVLHGVASLANVVTTNHVNPSQLLDRQAIRIAATEVAQCDEILVNPLNLARTPHFEKFSRSCAGSLLYETRPTHRMICVLIPPLRDHPWSLRKPPARVFECADIDRSRITYAHHE